jgi:hypothetical protein
MKKQQLTVLVAILVLGTTGTPWLHTGITKAMSQTSEKQAKPLTWFLHTLGRYYDCFFTIEDGCNEADSGNMLEAGWTEQRLENGGLAHELEQLRRSVPNFSYEFNTVNSRIVHIIDERLKQQGE